MSEVEGGSCYLDPQEWQGEALPQRNDVLHPRRVQLIEGVEAGGQNTGQPGATQEVGGEEQSPHQHRVEGKHRVNVEKDGLHPGLDG